MSLPLLVTCRYQPCGRVFDVAKPSLQRTRKYCSTRCAARVNKNILAAGAGRRGGLASAKVRQRKVLAGLDGLSSLECFRVGYKCGLYSKLRQVRRRFDLVRKAS